MSVDTLEDGEVLSTPADKGRGGLMMTEKRARKRGDKPPGRPAVWASDNSMPPAIIVGPGPAPTAWISTDRPRAELAARGIAQLSKKEAKATPPAFAELLISIARSAQARSVA